MEKSSQKKKKKSQARSFRKQIQMWRNLDTMSISGANPFLVKSFGTMRIYLMTHGSKPICCDNIWQNFSQLGPKKRFFAAPRVELSLSDWEEGMSLAGHKGGMDCIRLDVVQPQRDEEG